MICLLVPSVALAEGTVAVGGIGGPTGAQVRIAIENALKGKTDIVPGPTFQAAAREAGAPPGDPATSAQVGAGLGADAVVVGNVTRAGRQWKATIQLVETRSGEVTQNWVYETPGLRSLAVIARRQAWTKLGAAIRSAASSGPVAAAPPAIPTEQRKVRVALLPFGGGRAGARARQIIGATLNKKPDVVFVKGSLVAQKAEEIGVGLDDPVGRIATAELMELNVFIEGRVFRRGQYWFGVASAHQGVDGETIETVKLRRKSVNALGAAMAARLVQPVLNAQGPAPLEPLAAAAPPAAQSSGLSLDAYPQAQPDSAPAAAEPAASVAAKPERKPRPRGADARSRTPLRASLGFNTFFRTFDFNDVQANVGGLARPYESNFSPAIEIVVDWFPAAHFQDDGYLRNIGVGLDADYAFGLSSTDEVTGAEFPTNSFSIEGSVMGRFPFGANEVGAEVGFGTDQFALDPSETGEDPATPDVEYTYLRLGASGRWRALWFLDVLGSAGYRFVFDSGEIGSDPFFPNLDVGAFDAELAVSTPILDPIHFELGANYQHYFFSLNPSPDDPSFGQGTVIGGALDQYVTGFLRVLFVL